MMTNKYHIPVLLHPSVDGLNINPDGVYVDITFGGGGHSAEILKRLGSKGRLIAFDQDEDARQNAFEDERFKLVTANFRFIKRFLRVEGIREVDGILGDLGVSSHQFDVADRGFSIRMNARLDMRMSQKQELDAWHVVNKYEEEDLRRIFFEYGELKNATKLAQTVAEERVKTPIDTSEQLMELLWPLLFKRQENKIMARIFQAIRIEVNGEMDALKEFLMQTVDLIKPDGRLSLISYHSLEDRLVKRFIRSGLFEGQPKKDFYGNIYTPFKKVGQLIVPTEEEIEQNNRARSAKLRIGERQP